MSQIMLQQIYTNIIKIYHMNEFFKYELIIKIVKNIRNNFFQLKKQEIFTSIVCISLFNFTF